MSELTEPSGEDLIRDAFETLRDPDIVLDSRGFVEREETAPDIEALIAEGRTDEAQEALKAQRETLETPETKAAREQREEARKLGEAALAERAAEEREAAIDAFVGEMIERAQVEPIDFDENENPVYPEGHVPLVTYIETSEGEVPVPSEELVQRVAALMAADAPSEHWRALVDALGEDVVAAALNPTADAMRAQADQEAAREAVGYAPEAETEFARLGELNPNLPAEIAYETFRRLPIPPDEETAKQIALKAWEFAAAAAKATEAREARLREAVAMHSQGDERHFRYVFLPQLERDDPGSYALLMDGIERSVNEFAERVDALMAGDFERAFPDAPPDVWAEAAARVADVSQHVPPTGARVPDFNPMTGEQSYAEEIPAPEGYGFERLHADLKRNEERARKRAVEREFGDGKPNDTVAFLNRLAERKRR